MKSLRFLKRMSQDALDKYDLVRIAAYSVSPSVAFKAAKQLDWGVRNAKSCRFLSIIKRDHGYDNFFAFVYGRYDADRICFCDCHLGAYDLQSFIYVDTRSEFTCGCCDDAECFHAAHTEEWDCPLCSGEDDDEYADDNADENEWNDDDSENDEDNDFENDSDNGNTGYPDNIYESPIERLQRISDAIQYATGTDYAINEVDSDILNAWADGTNICVTSALLQLLDDDELAFIIAHEAIHNKMRHPQSKARRYNNYYGAIMESAQSPGGFFRKAVTTTAVGVVGALCTRYVDRSNERMSDKTAKRIMQQAGFAGWKAAQAMRKLGYSEAGWFSTHPGSAERIEYLENE